MRDSLPPELEEIRQRRLQREREEESAIPDFLRRKVAQEEKETIKEDKPSRIPSFEEFKKQMEEEGGFNPFEEITNKEEKEEKTVKETPKPTRTNIVIDNEKEDDDDDDDLGFDVDELVRKIDAKIAELEEEERKSKEEKAKEEKPVEKVEEAKVESIKEIKPEKLEEDVDQKRIDEQIRRLEEERKLDKLDTSVVEKTQPKDNSSVKEPMKPLPTINLDDDDDDDDFFDDFFDN